MHKASPAKIWRKFHNRYQLKGVICVNCKKIYYPSVCHCLKCGSNNFESFVFKDAAKLITWSVVYAAQEGFEDSLPYIIAIVELEQGERLTSQLVNIEISDLHYGLDLVPTFRKVFSSGDEGIIHYALKFTKA